MSDLFLSVVVPFNGTANIQFLLNSIKKQTLDTNLFELIVVEEGNHLSAKLIQEQGFSFRTSVIPSQVPKEFNGHSAGLSRNTGALFASGKVLIFVDSDCILCESFLEEYFKAYSFNSNQILPICLFGSTDELPGSKRYLLKDSVLSFSSLREYCRTDHRIDDLLNMKSSSNQGDNLWYYWYSLNCSIPIDLFEKLNGFNKLGYRCHDQELALRAFLNGAQFKFLPEAYSIHVEHFRSINHKIEQLKGWRYILESFEEAASVATDRIISIKRYSEALSTQCEYLFRGIIANLIGYRIGYTFVVTEYVDIFEHLNRNANGVHHETKKYRDHFVVYLALDRDCWDYHLTVIYELKGRDPDVSVIIPLYNASGTISKALESLLSQSLQNFELLLVDDDSNDSTLTDISFLRNDSRVRIIQHIQNMGLSQCMNTGLDAVKSRYIVQLDADDFIQKDALLEIFNHFELSPNVGAIYAEPIIHCEERTEYPSGVPISTPWDVFKYPTYQVPRAYSTSILKSIGGWSVSDAFSGRYYEDRFTLYRVANCSEVLFLNKTLYNVIERKSSLSRERPIESAVSKLMILYSLSSKYQMKLSYELSKSGFLSADFKNRTIANSIRFSWSVIIPFGGSMDHLKYSLLSWLQSDLVNAPNFEIIVVCDDASPTQLVDIFKQEDNIRFISTAGQMGAAHSRNIGVQAASYDMFFFSDSDRIVPPNVIRLHEEAHLSNQGHKVVIGDVFGSRCFTTLSGDERINHKKHLLDLFRFNEDFNDIAGKIAFMDSTDLLSDKNIEEIWSECAKCSFVETWFRSWGEIFLKYGLTLKNYEHRWSRVNTGSMSIHRSSFEKVGFFDEDFRSTMEDWEFGIRAQEENFEIRCIPEAEPFHQVHPVRKERASLDRINSRMLIEKHPIRLAKLFDESNNPPPAQRTIRNHLNSKYTVQLDSKNSAQKHFALTFDDGPNPGLTTQILDLLDKYCAQATFFLLAKECKKYPAICREVMERGHEIGCHGWMHEDMSGLNYRESKALLQRATSTMEDILGIGINLFRPPYGKANASLLKYCIEANLQAVGWDVSARDWNANSAFEVIRVLSCAGIAGKVLLFHDARVDIEVSIESLSWLLHEANRRICRSLSISDFSELTVLPGIDAIHLSKPRRIHGTDSIM